MKNSIQDPEPHILYTNTFGTVFKENFTIHAVENRKIDLRNLRKVKLVKQRSYRKNLFFFGIALITACIFYTHKGNKELSFAFAVTTILTMLISMLIAEYHFKFIIFRRNDFTAYPTTRRYSDDAQQLALLVNKEIRSYNSLSGF